MESPNKLSTAYDLAFNRRLSAAVKKLWIMTLLVS
jgi:hypothetical protein